MKVPQAKQSFDQTADTTRRRLILGFASASVLIPVRARADFLESLKEGFSAGVNSTAPGTSSAMQAWAVQTRRISTAEADTKSLEAEAYFRANRLSMDSNRFSYRSLRADAAAYREVLRGAARPGRTTLNFAEASQLGFQLIPLATRLDEAWFYGQSLADGQVYIPACSAVKVEFTGLCLDRLLAAPNVGDRLRLLPISSVTDKKTAKAMEAIARRSRNYIEGAPQNRRYEAKAEMQSLVWALRDMQLGYKPNLSDFQWKMLASLDPEGFGKGDGLDKFAWRLGEAFGKDVRRNFGGVMDLSNMGTVGRRMEEISRASPMHLPTGSPYSQVAPGVHAMAVGSGPLAASLVVANATPAPAMVDLPEHVAEAANDTQRILIASVVRGDTSWLPSLDEEIVSSLIDEEKKLALKASLEWLPDGVARVGLSPNSILAGKLLSATPLIGNAISAAELFYGYEWTEWFKPEEERKRMNQAERLLALAGTVPGAGALAKVVGKGAMPVLLAKAGQLADRTDMARDVSGLAVGFAPDLYEKAVSAWDDSRDPVTKISATQMEPVVRETAGAVGRM